MFETTHPLEKPLGIQSSLLQESFLGWVYVKCGCLTPQPQLVAPICQ